MVQSEVAELLDDVQPLCGADVPIALLLDLSEEPRLDDRPPGNKAIRNFRWLP